MHAVKKKIGKISKKLNQSAIPERQHEEDDDADDADRLNQSALPATNRADPADYQGPSLYNPFSWFG